METQKLNLIVLFGTLFQPDCTASLFWRVGGCVPAFYQLFQSISFCNKRFWSYPFSMKSQGVGLITWMFMKHWHSTIHHRNYAQKRNRCLALYSQTCCWRYFVPYVEAGPSPVCRNIREQLLIYFWTRLPFWFSVRNIRSQIWFIHKY